MRLSTDNASSLVILPDLRYRVDGDHRVGDRHRGGEVLSTTDVTGWLTHSAPSTVWVDFESPYRLSIGGEMIATEEDFEVLNPATNEVLARAPMGSADQLDSAVAAAKQAFPAWSALDWDERRQYLTRYADALDAQKRELDRLLTLEQGKPLLTMAT